MKHEVKWTKVSNLCLCSVALSWAFLIIMILMAGHQASAQQTPASAVQQQQITSKPTGTGQLPPPAQQVAIETENDKPIFTIEGEVVSAGRFDLAKDLRVKDAIMKSGGLTKDADLNLAEIIRFNKRQKAYYTIYFKVANALSGDPSDNFILLDKDRIIIHSIRGRVDLAPTDQKKVSIDGEIANPGSYPYTEGMTVRDLILKSGSILKTSHMEEAQISAIISGESKLSGTGRKIINLQKAMEGDPAHNVPLQPNDRLLVKKMLDEVKLLDSFSASGEFRLPGKYGITKGERLSSLIERSGGYAPDAYLRGAVFIRERVRQLQRSSLEEMAARIEKELLLPSAATTNDSISAEEAQNKKAEAEIKMKLLRYLKTLKATGRITIALKHVRLLKRTPDDIELEDGDNLYIPRKPGTVSVMGAVMKEGAHIYHDKWDYGDYIAAAGGYARYADESDVFVIKVDGSAQKLTSGFFEWSRKRERRGIEAFGQGTDLVEPGDVIVVPERIANNAWLRETRDITQILLNTGVVKSNDLKK